VPTYAVLEVAVLEGIERELAQEGDDARKELDAAFHRFEATQPHLADRVSAILSRPLDETALALGYFLSIAIWLAFERVFKARLGEVSADALKATEDALSLEEELRASHADEPFDLDDVVAMEQPGVLSFVHGHAEQGARESPREARDVDVDDVHLVYRAILVLTLALSHAVAPEGGPQRRGREMMA